jgi:hypothetical protein
MANLDMTPSLSTLSSETTPSDSSSDDTVYPCANELRLVADALVELSRTLEKANFSEETQTILDNLSRVHHNFYVMHNAIFDKINWQRRNELYEMSKRASRRPQMTEQELDTVLSKLGL